MAIEIHMTGDQTYLWLRPGVGLIFSNAVNEVV